MTAEITQVTAAPCGGLAARSAPGVEGQRAVGASEASALGSTQSYCFTPELSGKNGDVRGVSDGGERRRERWAARAMLWQASSLKAVRCCGRLLHNDGVGDPDDGQSVLVRRREVDGRMVASFGGLVTCGSVWACPRCSAVIAHTRATEIGAAVRECYRRGGKVYLLTATLRHSSRDGLAALWDALGAGWRSAFGSRSWTGQKPREARRRGRVVQIGEIIGDAECFDVAGLTRVVETTYGSPADGGHGWHLHIHALVFCASSLARGLVSELPAWLPKIENRDWLARNAFAARIHSRWSAGVMRAGYRLPGAVAVDVREINDQGAEYLGKYLSKATYDAASKIGVEIAGGQVSKTGRVARNRTPFEVLADLASSVDARGFGVRTPRRWSVTQAGDGDWAVIDTETGEVLAVTAPGEWKVWHEWEQGSKGRRQIMWSRRRKDPTTARENLWNVLLVARGMTAEESDEAVAAVDTFGQVVGEISRKDWYRTVVWRPELIVDILEVAETGGVRAISDVLAGYGVAFIEHPPPSADRNAA
jgi:hypothetical protein